MNKTQKMRKYYNQKEKLTLKNPKYLRQVKWLVDFTLSEDLDNNGDITTKTLIKQNIPTKAVIIAKQDGIVAGIEEMIWLLKRYKIQETKCKHDGDIIKAGQKIMLIKGGIKDILKTERLALNILQRMSGIATATKRMTTGHKALVVSTRKTLWGLLDKKSVTVGGGGTHRLGLYDWMLVKDNHWEIPNIKYPISNQFWEIEVKNETELKKALTHKPSAIMLDNFKPDNIKQILNKYSKDLKNIIIEASGMVNENNIKQYANSGVDVISIGALTHSAKALDISLDLL